MYEGVIACDQGIAPGPVMADSWSPVRRENHAQLVDPPDDMSLGNPPSNKPLLDYLARGFIEHGFDMKRIHREITNSRTCQLRSPQRLKTPLEIATSMLQSSTGKASSVPRRNSTFVRPTATTLRWALVASPDHLLARKRTVNPNELEGMDLILRESGSDSRFLTEGWFAERQVAVNTLMALW